MDEFIDKTLEWIMIRVVGVFSGCIVLGVMYGCIRLVEVLN